MSLNRYHAGCVRQRLVEPVVVHAPRLKTLSSNHLLRMHYHKRSDLQSTQRKAIWGRLWQAFGNVRPQPDLVILLIRHSRKTLDCDNLRGALKTVRDEVAAFVGVDDGPRGPIEWDYQQAIGPAGVTIILRPKELP